MPTVARSPFALKAKPMSEERDEFKGRKVYRAGSFAKSVMACPGCRLTTKDPVDQCHRCGCTGHVSVEKFPFPAPPMERFIDPAGNLNEVERREIGKALAKLAKKFPQPRFCFCVLDLSPEADPREFGFWMMNASPVADQEEAGLRPWTSRMVIDDANGRVSVSFGYAIEPFLDDEQLTAVLRFNRQYFFGRDYATGILKFIEGIEKVLKEGAERVEKKKRRKKSKKGSGNSKRERRSK